MSFTFDVSGRIIKTTSRTLRNARTSTIFKEILKIVESTSGYDTKKELGEALVAKYDDLTFNNLSYKMISIDRNPDHFAALIDFLRYGDLSYLPKDLNLKGLMKEARYFELDDLIELLEAEMGKTNSMLWSRNENIDKIIDNNFQQLICEQKLMRTALEDKEKAIQRLQEEIRTLKTGHDETNLIEIKDNIDKLQSTIEDLQKRLG